MQQPKAAEQGAHRVYNGVRAGKAKEVRRLLKILAAVNSVLRNLGSPPRYLGSNSWFEPQNKHNMILSRKSAGNMRLSSSITLRHPLKVSISSNIGRQLCVKMP